MKNWYCSATRLPSLNLSTATAYTLSAGISWRWSSPFETLRSFGYDRTELPANTWSISWAEALRSCVLGLGSLALGGHRRGGIGAEHLIETRITRMDANSRERKKCCCPSRSVVFALIRSPHSRNSRKQFQPLFGPWTCNSRDQDTDAQRVAELTARTPSSVSLLQLQIRLHGTSNPIAFGGGGLAHHAAGNAEDE
jgi:hypothetical protein